MKTRKFPNMPDIDPVSKRTWVLNSDYIGPMIDGKQTTIKAGFKTDGTSGGRLVYLLVGGRMQIPLLAASVLHDAEYAAELHPRKVCDSRYRSAMSVLAIGWLKRKVVYSGVRIGGWAVWAGHKTVTVANACKKVITVALPKKS